MYRVGSSVAAYIPHGHCYLWQTGLVGLHVTADILIALSYFSIPIALVYFAHRRQDLPFKGLFILFGAFIILCGITHLMAIWTLWHPDYWISGLIKATTALVSAITATRLIPIVPKALDLPNPEVLKAANAALKSEIQARETAEKRLQEQNQLLAKALQQLRKTQILLVQKEKMSSLGHLVAGLTHELNNPISFIHGNLYHLQSYAESLAKLISAYQDCCNQQDSQVAATSQIELDFMMKDLPCLIQSMQAGTARILEIMTSLHAFSRIDESGPKVIDINGALDNTLTILSSRLRRGYGFEDIQVARQYGDIPAVMGYPSQLNQVFLHVINNAIDSIEAQLSALPVSSGMSLAKRIEIETKFINSECVCINIRDYGIGIPEDIQRHIFDPFFTSHLDGHGRGMGLAISYQIVTELHGGALTFSSTANGTTFTIKLPVEAAPALTACDGKVDHRKLKQTDIALADIISSYG